MAENSQYPKNIIVLGLTQNGKSSFVDSILKYAQGDGSQAPAIGNGSTSQTKDIRKYAAKINIRRYKARKKGQIVDLTHSSEGSRVSIYYDNKGEAIDRNYEPLVFKESLDPETGERLVITQEFTQSVRRLQGGLVPDPPEPSGCIVRINMFDTPGLSDSGCIKDLEKDFMKQGYTETEAKEAAIKCPRNLIDERHKLSIINAANQIGFLHGVCIVIRDGKNFGPELEELYSLVETLRSISPDLKFYMIHTRVTNITMFQAKTLNRLRISEEFFNLRAAHFFVNNEPDLGDDDNEGDPLSQHFAYRVLSDFFFELLEAPGVKVGGLRYQKTNMILEETVASSLRIYRSYLESENGLLQDEVNVLKAKQAPSIQKIELYDKELEELRLKLSKIDTEEKVLVGEDAYQVTVGFFRSAHTVTFSILADTIIRHVEYDPPSHTEISWQKESQGIGTFKSMPKLTVYNGEITARVTAFSYRSDLEEDKIRSIKTQVSDISERKAQEQREIMILGDQLRAFASRIYHNKMLLKDSEALVEEVLSDYLSEEDISNLTSTRMRLQNTNSLYCIAKSYEFEHLIPRELIPHISNYDTSSSRNGLDKHAEFHYKMGKIALKSLRYVKKQAVANRMVQAQLNAVYGIMEGWVKDDGPQENMTESLQLITKNLMQRPELNTTAGKEEDPLAIYQSRVYKLFQPFEAKVEAWVEDNTETMNEAFEEVCTMRDHIEETLKELELHQEDWEMKLRYHRKSYDATRLALDILEKAKYPLEQFTILRVAFEEKNRNPEAEDPFIKLAQSIAYADQILTTYFY
ncbi:hypothetical protein TWF718_010222 [Orbilia javanica]|uniref:G domain-containing protein n=1 Tax=Orbilia javanica TaxID=47235 RepID=A0AAN8MJD1_9PEZI